MNIPFAESDSVNGSDGGQTSNDVNRNRKTCDDLTAASKSGKRKAYLQEGSYGRHSKYCIIELLIVEKNGQ
jgi:hypothetical protein